MALESRKFEPHRWLRGGHAQTIGAALAPRKFALSGGTERFFRVDGETQLKGICHWQEGKRRDLPVIVIVHGLEGSSDSNYARGISGKALVRGFHSIRMNQRNCGGTEQLTPTLYNSGLSGDYRAVLMELIGEGFEKIFFAGCSMGGNLVTKMAGELSVTLPRRPATDAAVFRSLPLPF